MVSYTHRDTHSHHTHKHRQTTHSQTHTHTHALGEVSSLRHTLHSPHEHWYLIMDSHLFLLKPPGPSEHSLHLSCGTGDTIWSHIIFCPPSPHSPGGGLALAVTCPVPFLRPSVWSGPFLNQDQGGSQQGEFAVRRPSAGNSIAGPLP